MRNHDFSLLSAHPARLWLQRGLAAVLLLLAGGCTTVIEEGAYEGLSLGASKEEVLSRLDAAPMPRDVQPALPRPDNVEPRSRAPEREVIRLAAASVGGGTLSSAEREYLAQYDRWYFEDSDGERAVLLVFAEGLLAEIHNRREGTWLESLF